MMMLQDHEAAIVIERLFELERIRKEYRDVDNYNRTLAEKLALQFSHCEGREL